MLEIEKLDLSVVMLSPTTSQDDILATLDAVENLAARVRELRKKADEQLIKWIHANGPFTFNGTKYCLGRTKTVKCKDKAVTVAVCFDQVDGDFEAFVGLLTSDALKPGAVKTLIGLDEFDAQFETTYGDTIKMQKIPEEILERAATQRELLEQERLNDSAQEKTDESD